MTSYVRKSLEAGQNFEDVMDAFFGQLMVKAVNVLIDFLIDHPTLCGNNCGSIYYPN